MGQLYHSWLSSCAHHSTSAGAAPLCKAAGTGAAFTGACEGSGGSGASCEDVFNLVLVEPQKSAPSVLAGRHAVLVRGITCVALGHGIVPASTATAWLRDSAAAPAISTLTASARCLLTPTSSTAQPFCRMRQRRRAGFRVGDDRSLGQLLAGPAVRDDLTQLVTGMQVYTAASTTAAARGGMRNAGAPGDSSATESPFCDGMCTAGATASALRGIMASPAHNVFAV
jgi:hypothetical protein